MKRKKRGNMVAVKCPRCPRVVKFGDEITWALCRCGHQFRVGA